MCAFPKHEWSGARQWLHAFLTSSGAPAPCRPPGLGPLLKDAFCLERGDFPKKLCVPVIPTALYPMARA